MARPRHRQAGFTTVELMISMAIGSFMLAVALQAFGDMLPRWRARQAAEDIAAAVRSGRAKAVRTGQTQLVPFDVPGQRYGRPSSSHGSMTGVTLFTLPYGIKFATPSGGTNPVDVQPPSSSDRAVEFNARGQLRSQTVPGYIHLGDTRKGIYSRVVVDLVGGVRVERWKEGRWQ